MPIHHRQNQHGITLLITLLLMGVLLGIGATLLNVTLSQLRLSSIALESEMAFQAANAGVECVLYHDLVGTSPFDVPGNGGEQSVVPAISCMGTPSVRADVSSNNGGSADTTNIGNDNRTVGNGMAASGDEQRFRFNWDNRCTEVSVYKFYEDYTKDPDDNGIAVEVDGEDMRDNVDCPEGSECTVVKSRGYNVGCSDINVGGRVVEREYVQVY